ncbi:glycosyltransferase [Flavobacteriaceae bacterium]|nr:glycosyltransferase [Flavobacteriaceae bacterium]
MGKISIITICFNSEKTIFKTLESVKKQSFSNIEHIIIDGASNDKTLEICKEYSNSIKIISEPDNGVYDAFNKGLKLATGEIIGFLNADDVFYSEKAVEDIVNAFSNNETDIVYGNLDYVNKEGKVIRNWISKPYEKGLVKKGWMPAHPTFYCKKEFYDRLGGYNDSFKIAGDFELCLRFLEVNQISSYYLNKKVVKMLVGGISNSGLKSKWTIFKEELRAFKINNISVNPFLFFLYKLKKLKQFF